MKELDRPSVNYESVKMKQDDVMIGDEIIKHIIENYTDEEKGVRNLKRCLEIIYTKSSARILNLIYIKNYIQLVRRLS